MEDVSEQLVKTLPLCSISRIVAPVTPTVVPLFTAEAEVNLTVPKLANGTREQLVPHSSKSSTIHSALYSHKDPSVTPVKVSVFVTPVVRFSMTAEPEVLEVAVTVIKIESPADMVMPEKSSRRVCQYHPTALIRICKGRLTSIVRVPLIPGIIADGSSLDIPVKASLEDSGRASIAVDADPLRYTKVSKCNRPCY